MKLFVVVAAVVARGAAGSSEGHQGRDLTCPDSMSSTFLDHGEGDPGARTAALAAAPFLDTFHRVVEDGGPETVTFRGYDTERHLLGIVRVIQADGQWYADRVDTCE